MGKWVLGYAMEELIWVGRIVDTFENGSYERC